MHGLRDTVGAAAYPKGAGSTIRSCPRGVSLAPAARTPAAITTPPVGFKYPSILPVGADDPVRPSK